MVTNVQDGGFRMVTFNITLKEREAVSQMGDSLSFVFRFVLFE